MNFVLHLLAYLAVWGVVSAATECFVGASELSDLRAALSRSHDSGAAIRMNGIDVPEALRIEADAISDIDRRLKLLEVIEHDNLSHLKQMDNSK